MIGHVLRRDTSSTQQELNVNVVYLSCRVTRSSLKFSHAIPRLSSAHAKEGGAPAECSKTGSCPSLEVQETGGKDLPASFVGVVKRRGPTFNPSENIRKTLDFNALATREVLDAASVDDLRSRAFCEAHEFGDPDLLSSILLDEGRSGPPPTRVNTPESWPSWAGCEEEVALRHMIDVVFKATVDRPPKSAAWTVDKGTCRPGSPDEIWDVKRALGRQLCR